MTAAEQWREALARWAIPPEILDVAPDEPWGFSTDVFVAATREAIARPPTATHRRISEALPPGGTLLDVGAGAGAASLPTAAEAIGVVAVDENPEMLHRMVELAGEATPQVQIRAVPGRWPDVAGKAGSADVVACANVAYNVAELAPFIRALTGAAYQRVVLELTAVHPQTPLSPLWQHFWNLERPSSPTAQDALDVVRETIGCEVEAERWTRPRFLDGDPTWLRRRLCLGQDADAEIGRILDATPALAVEMVTAWWPGTASLTA